VNSFSVGQIHSFVILDNYQLKCFGEGGSGQLGYGDVFYRGDTVNEMSDYFPLMNISSSSLVVHSLQVSSFHTYVLLNDNSLKCFGGNNFGQLGIGSTDDQGDHPNEMGDFLKPINFGNNIEIIQCLIYLLQLVLHQLFFQQFSQHQIQLFSPHFYNLQVSILHFHFPLKLYFSYFQSSYGTSDHSWTSIWKFKLR